MNLVELQVWEYGSTLLTKTNLIEIVSLYASLQGEQNERIGQALEEVLQVEDLYID